LVKIHVLNSNMSIRVKYNFKKFVKYSCVIDAGRGHVMNYDPVIKLIFICKNFLLSSSCRWLCEWPTKCRWLLRNNIACIIPSAFVGSFKILYTLLFQHDGPSSTPISNKRHNNNSLCVTSLLSWIANEKTEVASNPWI
jgi:hypothetical protein